MSQLVQGEWRKMTPRELRMLAEVMGIADRVRVLLTPRIAQALDERISMPVTPTGDTDQ